MAKRLEDEPDSCQPETGSHATKINQSITHKHKKLSVSRAKMRHGCCLLWLNLFCIRPGSWGTQWESDSLIMSGSVVMMIG